MVPVFLHTLGKVPGSRGCVCVGACDAQAGLHASAYRVTTSNRGEGTRRAGRGVREPALPRDVRGAGGAPPARRSRPPACRGGLWVSDAARPLWAAPGSVPPAAIRLGRRPAAAPVAGQMQVAGEMGVSGPFEMSIRVLEENGNRQ